MGDQVPVKKWGLGFICQLKPCQFHYKPPVEDGREHFGFIAQDVDMIAPKEKFGFVANVQGLNYVNYNEFIGPMVTAIQELEARVKELEDQAHSHRR